MSPFVPLAARLAGHGDRLAIVDPGRVVVVRRPSTTTPPGWPAVLHDGLAVGDRIAILCTPGHDFVVALLACWQAGAIAVPLHPQHPDAELRYALEDSAVAAIIASVAHRDIATRVADGPGGRAWSTSRRRPAVRRGGRRRRPTSRR